jgi:hypothetical protein
MPRRHQAVLSESKVTNFELTARARDGKETVVSYNATTFYDRDRKLQGVFAAARDVTERKRFDQVLRKTTSSWRAPRSVADKANLAKSNFLSSMSHELRTPAERHPRLRPTDGIRLAAADTLAEGKHRPDPPGRLASAGTDQ